MKSRITPEYVTELKPNEIFVFGSNESGIHGKGAAKMAMQWGAKYGNPEGIQGSTYAIPTKNKSISKTLEVSEIEVYVNRFIEYALSNPDSIFLVTEIGCGLAGLTPKQVAPMFKKAISMNNIHLPYRFWHILSISQ